MEQENKPPSPASTQALNRPMDELTPEKATKSIKTDNEEGDTEQHSFKGDGKPIRILNVSLRPPSWQKTDDGVFIGPLPRGIHQKILAQLDHEHQLASVALVSRAMRELTLLGMRREWRNLYREMFEYPRPLIRVGPLEFRFIDPDEFESENIWATALSQFRRAIHVHFRPSRRMMERSGEQRIFTSFNNAMSYVSRYGSDYEIDEKWAETEQMVILHSGVHYCSLNESITVMGNTVIFLGTADSPKPCQQVKIMSSNPLCRSLFHFQDQRVYFGHLSFATSISNSTLMDAYIHAEECGPVTISHCLFRNFAKRAIIIRDTDTFTTCHLITKCYFVHVGYAISLLETSTKVVKCSFHLCSVGVYCTKRTRADVYANTFLGCERALSCAAFSRLTVADNIRPRLRTAFDSILDLSQSFRANRDILDDIKHLDIAVNGRKLPPVPTRLPYRVEVIYNEFRNAEDLPVIDFDDRCNVDVCDYVLGGNFYIGCRMCTDDDTMVQIIMRIMADKMETRFHACRGLDFMGALNKPINVTMLGRGSTLLGDPIDRIFMTQNNKIDLEVAAKKTLPPIGMMADDEETDDEEDEDADDDESSSDREDEEEVEDEEEEEEVGQDSRSVGGKSYATILAMLMAEKRSEKVINNEEETMSSCSSLEEEIGIQDVVMEDIHRTPPHSPSTSENVVPILDKPSTSKL